MPLSWDWLTNYSIYTTNNSILHIGNEIILMILNEWCLLRHVELGLGIDKEFKYGWHMHITNREQSYISQFNLY